MASLMLPDATPLFRAVASPVGTALRSAKPLIAAWSLAPLLLVAAIPLLARDMYRYINDQGNVVVDYAVPSEYVHKGYEILTTDGVVKQVVPRALTDEERASQALERQAEEAQALEIARLKAWDESLMLRYSSIADIEAARERALRELKVRVSILKSNTRSLRQQVESYQAKAADIERAGARVSVEMLASIDDLQQDIVATERSIKERMQEMLAVEESFQADMDRFEMLLDRVELRRKYSRTPVPD